jgi:hypothetical protein
MNAFVSAVNNTPTSVKITSDLSVLGVVAVGWLGWLQPWLTAIATVLAIVWTGIQIYSYIQLTYKRRIDNKK